MLKEAMLRLRILAESPEACDPARYGHPLVGDDYWILAGSWNTFHALICYLQFHISDFLNPVNQCVYRQSFITF